MGSRRWGGVLSHRQRDQDCDRDWVSGDDALEISHPPESAGHLLLTTFAKLEANRGLHPAR